MTNLPPAIKRDNIPHGLKTGAASALLFGWLSMRGDPETALNLLDLLFYASIGFTAGAFYQTVYESGRRENDAAFYRWLKQQEGNTDEK